MILLYTYNSKIISRFNTSRLTKFSDILHFNNLNLNFNLQHIKSSTIYNI